MVDASGGEGQQLGADLLAPLELLVGLLRRQGLAEGSTHARLEPDPQRLETQPGELARGFGGASGGGACPGQRNLL